MLYGIKAKHSTGRSRYFLVESLDLNLAKSLFLVNNRLWEVERAFDARCFAAGEHKGDLSVWEGQGGQTAILCQHHGENPV